MRDSIATDDDDDVSRPRHWTALRQCRFLVALEQTRCVSDAAAAAGLSRESAYRYRRRHPDSLFARMWDAILRTTPAGGVTARHLRRRAVLGGFSPRMRW